jgi:nickel-dependent lactate racemase
MLEKTYIEHGGPELAIADNELDELFSQGLARALSDLGDCGPVIIVPPDITRFHSRAGFLTDIASRELARPHGSGPSNRLGAVLPALGTHTAMTPSELDVFFPHTPKDKFIVHDWRNGITELGRLEGSWVKNVTKGAVDYDWPAQVNKTLNKTFSLIISIGQVVPHEVSGMANHAKNIFVGTGGKEAIDKSHFAGAIFGMERSMGKTDTPVRALFDEGFRRFGNKIPPVLWVLTVVGGQTRNESGDQEPLVRGLFVGFGRECFEKAAALAREVNVDIMDEPVQKAVAYLDPREFRTTWVGNKAVYRTRMAIADGGELVILAPGLERFGEDLSIDSIIRRHGYRPSEEITARIGEDGELGANLSAAAHLIHGCSNGRFTVRYCPGPGVTKKEIESVGYKYGSLEEAMSLYNIKTLVPGWNTTAEEKIFYVPNPALGLWAEKNRFNIK